jgi:hypothetical protein
MTYESTAELFEAVRREIARPDYPQRCKDEQAFERVVWNRLRALIVNAATKDSAKLCLTSHTWAEGRSASEWRAFCSEDRGADVNVLGCNNRLDIVLRHPDGGSIGVEVKCLGAKGHAGKLTQGIGQVMLALAHRDHTLLAIHCGTVKARERDQLRAIATSISAPPRMAIVVVP